MPERQGPSLESGQGLWFFKTVFTKVCRSTVSAMIANPSDLSA